MRQGLVAGEPDALQVEQRVGGGAAQFRGGDLVGAHVHRDDGAALDQALRLHLTEQRVQAAEGLLDGGGAHPGRPPSGRVDQPRVADAAQRLAHRVPGDLVRLLQLELAGEAVMEGARTQPAQQVLVQLGPQRQRAAPVEHPRRVRSSHRAPPRHLRVLHRGRMFACADIVGRVRGRLARLPP